MKEGEPRRVATTKVPRCKLQLQVQINLTDETMRQQRRWRKKATDVVVASSWTKAERESAMHRK